MKRWIIVTLLVFLLLFWLSRQRQLDHQLKLRASKNISDSTLSLTINSKKIIVKKNIHGATLTRDISGDMPISIITLEKTGSDVMELDYVRLGGQDITRSFQKPDGSTFTGEMDVEGKYVFSGS